MASVILVRLFLTYYYSAHDQAAFDKDRRLTGHAPAALRGAPDCP
jgi:hypothetical protein